MDEQAISSPAELARWIETHHGDHPEWVEELRDLLPVAGRPSRYQPLSRADLDKRIQAADKPGQHLWIMTGAWRIRDPASAYDPDVMKLLDLENLLMFGGPGCYKCEKPYSGKMAKRACLGSVDEVQP